VRFLHNWSWDEVSVPVPAAVRDVLSGAVHPEAVPLRPWDVKVLQEERP
jgi:beta-galactosidase